ncbi:hypothetical protein KC218_25710, partial [Mycobacterium tuberculosis]|nr:hypothetical protein [Mycobacterium tuberculosis]
GSVAEELVDLALQLTQQFLHGALHAQPERILPLIREVLGDAPTAPAPMDDTVTSTPSTAPTRTVAAASAVPCRR